MEPKFTVFRLRLTPRAKNRFSPLFFFWTPLSGLLTETRGDVYLFFWTTVDFLSSFLLTFCESSGEARPSSHSCEAHTLDVSFFRTIGCDFSSPRSRDFFPTVFAKSCCEKPMRSPARTFPFSFVNSILVAYLPLRALVPFPPISHPPPRFLSKEVSTSLFSSWTS